jgi:hypothetical protein
MPDDIRDELLDDEEGLGEDLLDPEEPLEEDGDSLFLMDDAEGEES